MKPSSLLVNASPLLSVMHCVFGGGGGAGVSPAAGVKYFSSQKHPDPLAIESREFRGISQRMGEIMFVFFSHRFPPDVQSWSKGGTRAAACD